MPNSRRHAVGAKTRAAGAPHTRYTKEKTMKNTILTVFLLLLFVGLSFVAGIHIGQKRGFVAYFNQDVSTTATLLGAKVKALEMIKKGEIDKAEEYIEKFVDNDLGYLGVNVQNKLLKDKKQLLEAIQQAKTYREKYPGHTVNQTLSPGVTNAFKQVSK